MKLTSFQNKGLIDIRMITTFGVSVKENQSPIGYFGTGLKYAIAIILREGGSITIYNGTEVYSFSIAKTTIRSKEFEVIQMFVNGEPQLLPFTTELGKNWELWQAYRELYCNCTDEGGVIVDGKLEHSVDSVTIVVDCFGDIDYRSFILSPDDWKVMSSDEKRTIYGIASGKVFYKGVLVHTLDNSLLTYNFHKGLELTEDRTLKYSSPVKREIVKFIMSECKDEEFLNMALCGDYIEGKHTYPGEDVKPSDVILQVIKKILLEGEHLIDQHYASLVHIDMLEDVFVMKDKRYDHILGKAVEFLVNVGLLPNGAEYPTVFVEKLQSDRALAMAKDGKIYMTQRVMDMGIKQVASTYLEEHYHLKHGFKDLQFSNILV
jgi:hypothetical protein